MNHDQRGEKIFTRIEHGVVVALRVLIMLLTMTATVILFVLFAGTLPRRVGQISSAGHLLETMQTAFAGVLGIVLGLEISETLKSYFAEHQVKLEVILVVATIAVSRHLIQIDFAHAAPGVLFGLSALVLCLTIGYVIVKRG